MDNLWHSLAFDVSGDDLIERGSLYKVLIQKGDLLERGLSRAFTPIVIKVIASFLGKRTWGCAALKSVFFGPLV